MSNCRDTHKLCQWANVTALIQCQDQIFHSRGGKGCYTTENLASPSIWPPICTIKYSSIGVVQLTLATYLDSKSRFAGIWPLLLVEPNTGAGEGLES